MISIVHIRVCDACALTTRPVGVNPGGSGKLDDLGFEAGFELRSTTHFGGGGGSMVVFEAIVCVVGGLCVDGGDVVGMEVVIIIKASLEFRNDLRASLLSTTLIATNHNQITFQRLPSLLHIRRPLTDCGHPQRLRQSS